MLTILQNFFSPPRHLIFLIIALWAGLSLASRYALKRGLAGSKLENLVLVSLLAGLLGGRLGYAAEYAQAFLTSPRSLLSLNTDMFDAWSAFAFGLIGALIYFQRNQLPFWPTLDSMTPALSIIAIGIGLAHLASGEAFGAPSTAPWSIVQWGTRRHPSQFYEILAALSIFGLLWRQFSRSEKPGLLFLRFTALTSGLRLVLEAFRGDSLLILNGIRIAQVIAWVVLGCSFFGILTLSRNTKAIKDTE
jgi:phosphatidylglycerol:prolipoprotein diacylglycerol transferase